MAFVECSAKSGVNVGECFESLTRVWAGGLPVSSNAAMYCEEKDDQVSEGREGREKEEAALG